MSKTIELPQGITTENFKLYIFHLEIIILTIQIFRKRKR